MNKLAKTLAVFGTAGIIMSGAMGTVNAAPSTDEVTVSSVQSKIKQLDESNFAFRLAPGDKLSEDGRSIIGSNNKIEELPVSGKDKNGDAVEIVYHETDGVVVFSALKKDHHAYSTRSTRSLSDGQKCALGSGGSAGAGALTGAAAGATIGSVFPGVGTAAGWVIRGAIGGAVSGGAVGAATFC